MKNISKDNLSINEDNQETLEQEDLIESFFSQKLWTVSVLNVITCQDVELNHVNKWKKLCK